MGGWGLGAINTCVILLLPQSVNSMRRGGGKGAMIGTESQKLVWYASSIQERHLPLESSSSCTSCTTCTSTTALLLCIQQRHCPPKTCPQCLCLSMPCSSSLLLKSAIFSFEWHLRQGLAAFLDSKTCVLQVVLHLCIFICLKCLASVDFHLPAYNILGQTFPGWQVRPRKLSCVLTSFARANLFLQLLQLKCTIVHRTSPGWCTCSHFVSSRHCGLKVLTDGRDALQVWHTLTVRLAHFASGVRLPLPHRLLELPPPQFDSVDHIFCLATSPTSKPGLSCICQCSSYKFLTDN